VLPDKDLLNVTEVATYLGLHRRTVQRYVQEGKLPAYKVGKRYMVRREDLIKFLEEHKIQK
jgi:excisionase family DNA binding protein